MDALDLLSGGESDEDAEDAEVAEDSVQQGEPPAAPKLDLGSLVSNVELRGSDMYQRAGQGSTLAPESAEVSRAEVAREEARQLRQEQLAEIEEREEEEERLLVQAHNRGKRKAGVGASETKTQKSARMAKNGQFRKNRPG
mmetsp:Transcript_4162/g.11315  ORF Transcript_4162/g.11315 Transcript_4162/m.11315 type:complete len:141 (-) Transcript_4162:11-433(-)